MLKFYLERRGVTVVLRSASHPLLFGFSLTDIRLALLCIECHQRDLPFRRILSRVTSDGAIAVRLLIAKMTVKFLGGMYIHGDAALGVHCINWPGPILQDELGPDKAYYNETLFTFIFLFFVASHVETLPFFYMRKTLIMDMLRKNPKRRPNRLCVISKTLLIYVQMDFKTASSFTLLFSSFLLYYFPLSSFTLFPFLFYHLDERNTKNPNLTLLHLHLADHTKGLFFSSTVTHNVSRFNFKISCLQIEGGYVEDGRGKRKIKDNNTGDLADNHYHMFMEDIELMDSMAMNAYQLSISWTRILPNGVLLKQKKLVNKIFWKSYPHHHPNNQRSAIFIWIVSRAKTLEVLSISVAGNYNG
uniref:Uncharacterized protein n=1 Tax=Cucumis melo TaxID=3656 RepID=A0A9I9EIL5_CUCME